MEEENYILGGMVLIIILAVCGAIITSALGCKYRTQDIGEYSYGLVQGCLVKPEGTEKFIPIENYRVL